MRSVIAGSHMGHGVDPGDVIAGEVVARIVDSDDADWPAGTVVRCHAGWQAFTDQSTMPCPGCPRPESAFAGAVDFGYAGLTAWAGMVQQAKVRVGDVVVIPAAVGGVGAMAATVQARRCDDDCDYEW